MTSRQIITTLAFAIIFPILGLAGVVWYVQKSDAPIFPRASLFSIGDDFSFFGQQSATSVDMPVESVDTPTVQVENIDVSGAIDTSQGDAQEEDLVAVASPPAPVDSWGDFFNSYYPAHASLPTTTLLASSSSIYLRAVQAPDLYPLRNWEIPLRDVNGRAVAAFEAPERKALYQKNVFEPMPIASLSKLMTALVAVEALSLTEEVVVSKAAVETPHEAGGLVVGETLSVHQLLYALLLESSNDAAVALEEAFNLRRTEKDATLVARMNTRAKELGLQSAFFEEPTGLSEYNVASATDVASLIFAAYQQDTLRIIMGTSVFETKSKEGFAHRWVSSNSLLGSLPGVVAGKTGYTEEAGECMALITKRDNDRVVITVVLGSTNRAQAMSNLLNWLKEAYIWSS